MEVTAVAAETPPTASLCSHPLFGLHKTFTKHQQTLMGAIFSYIPSLHMHFRVRHHSVRLPSAAICHTATIGYWWEGSTSAAIPPTSAFVVGQHNIGDITIGTDLT